MEKHDKNLVMEKSWKMGKKTVIEIDQFLNKLQKSHGISPLLIANRT